MQKGEQLFPRIEDKQAEKILSEIESGASAEKSSEEKPADDEPVTITFDDFMKMDLRTGKIIEAEKIKKSKKLLKLQVDIGSEVRQIVAGIAECHEPENLIGKTDHHRSQFETGKIDGHRIPGNDPRRKLQRHYRVGRFRNRTGKRNTRQMIIDTHAHIDMEQFTEDREEVHPTRQGIWRWLHHQHWMRCREQSPFTGTGGTIRFHLLLRRSASSRCQRHRR